MFHPAIGMSPFFAMFGRDAPAPFEIVFGLGEGTTYPPMEDDIRARMNTIWSLVKEATKKAHEEEEYIYNQRHPNVQYEVGDLVMIHVTARKSRARMAKMSFHYIGPYQIVEKKNRLLYKVQPAATLEAVRRQQRDFGLEYINIGRLKKFNDVPAHLKAVARNLEELDIPAEELFDYEQLAREQAPVIVQQPVAPEPRQPTEQEMIDQLRIAEGPATQHEEGEREDE